MKYIIKQTDFFSSWLAKLKDQQGRDRILARLRLAAEGDFGDCKALGGGLSEMRINIGPGYRVYFGQIGPVIFLLICGGSKRTQAADIARARSFWKMLKGGEYEERD